MRSLYAAADCFILPTRYDPFPNTALEALAMGLPSIIGRRSGAAEILRPGEGGWVCEPGDIAGLARLMQEGALAARGAGAQAAARKTAAMASRINFVLSIPMLMCMGAASHGFPTFGTLS